MRPVRLPSEEACAGELGGEVGVATCVALTEIRCTVPASASPMTVLVASSHDAGGSYGATAAIFTYNDCV